MSISTLEYSNSLCEICGKHSNGKHFGVESCRACAAFFRRSLLQKSDYFCRKATGKCENVQNCQFCRLQKCRIAGMQNKNFKKLCKICGKLSTGIYFGVQSCLGCAAFFRKSSDQNFTFSCLDSDEKSMKICEKLEKCKFCRFQKCQEVGMSTMKRKVPENTAVKIVEERVSYSVWHPGYTKPVRWIDVNPILRRSFNILESFHPPKSSFFDNLNSLEKLTFSLSRLQSAQSKSPKFEYSMLFDDYFTHWENHMTRAAEWLMHSDEFRELPLHERNEFFKLVWALWRRVERNFVCAEIFGQKGFDEKIMIISDELATRLDDFDLDITEISSGTSFQGYRRIMRHNLNQYFSIVLKPCIDWKFTKPELNFALSRIVWIYAGRKLLGQTQSAGEKLLESLSNNLHEFYRNSMDIKNYAARLAVLLEMVNRVLKIQQEHEKVMEMAFLFDMFSVVVSDPKIFQV